MSKRITLLLYNLLWPLVLVVMLPGALIKMRRRGGRWQDLAQRIGRLPPAKLAAITELPTRSRRFWIHAVSVGEVGIAIKLITCLLKGAHDPGIVLTTTTPTGHALAEEFAAKQSGRVVVLYSPLDLPWVAQRLLNLLQPAQIVLVEAEVWPNLVSAARRRGIPVSLINARLSPRSERRFQSFGFLVRPIFAMLDQVLVQEPGDSQRWTKLGVPAERLHHTGSIKFDPQGAEVSLTQIGSLRAVLISAGITPEKPILLAASTHPGEEALLGRVYLTLQQRYPDLTFLIVPRHVERAAAIVTELRALGIDPQLRSAVTRFSDCLIIDTTGELRAWQCLATLVVVGKSFLAKGGQNPAEAVMAKKPVLFGPHMENFDALVDLLLARKGAIQVADVDALEQSLAALLADPAARDQLGEAGHAALQVHEGATEKTVARLLAHQG
jgi:3-deoxy-D-manno-octulosonic-acid transferase